MSDPQIEAWAKGFTECCFLYCQHPRGRPLDRTLVCSVRDDEGFMVGVVHSFCYPWLELYRKVRANWQLN